MATAAAGNDAAVKGGGKKKLIIIIVIVLVVVLAGVGALLMMKKKSHADDEDGAAADEKPAAAAHAKPGTPPTFVPLDPFTVNLADKEVDRFAQIGITLEVADAHFADQLKAYMPAIRNNVLIVLSHKTSAELLTVEGKEKLAKEIRRESVRPMGIELDDEDEDEDAAPKKKKKKKRAVESPVTQVLFSTFIVQ
ncbi:flagellar basal body rod protein [Roseateles aquatilis]|uniref:Flagellar protein FliL n=1 Tax=Roseateles aquatilis TaxID=431061 RepID=A0A246JF16_9BURK|nr:flagellar basal body-associated FliL family protein [Roseateles aquatilis]OWQ91274.1 flagellar basal body rod protein [Roseateles aquatilis]